MSFKFVSFKHNDHSSMLVFYYPISTTIMHFSKLFLQYYKSKRKLYLYLPKLLLYPFYLHIHLLKNLKPINTSTYNFKNTQDTLLILLSLNSSFASFFS